MEHLKPWPEQGVLTDEELRRLYDACAEEISKYTVRANAPRWMRAYVQVYRRSN